MENGAQSSRSGDGLQYPSQEPPSSLLDAMFDTTKGDRGILCNDPTGLCIASKGHIDTENSGIYTSLMRLAAQLPEVKNAAAQGASPLITIEYDSHATIVKEYDGHVVAVRVPMSSSNSADSTRSDLSAGGSGVGSGDHLHHTTSIDSSVYTS